MYVEVKGEGTKALDYALSEFKKKVKKNEILSDYRKHEYYIKPSAKRKLKRAEAIKRRRRDENARRKQNQRNRAGRDPESF